MRAAATNTTAGQSVAKITRMTVIHSCIVALMAGLAAIRMAPALAQPACSVDRLDTLRVPDLRLAHAEHLAATRPLAAPGQAAPPGLPTPHCRIEGIIAPRMGADGKPYGMKFALALPDQWNGRFLFQGGGGLNGTVREPLGATAAGDAPALSRGFAIVSTDSGHEGAVFDGSFFADQQAALDFLYNAVDRVTVAAKAIVTAHYGRAPNRSYFAGCSTGGREGMILSQRYPTHFDGIIAGAPAMRTGYSNIGMRWVSVSLQQAAERDPDGREIAGTAITQADRELVVESMMAACDANDGLSDGMLFDPLGCDFDVDTLQCAGAKTPACLLPRQVDAIERALAGPVNRSGVPVYAGYLYDNGLAATGEDSLPGLLQGARSPVDGPRPPTRQDVEAEAHIAALEPSALGATHAWTNLTTFSNNGGKLLFYHGVSDPWFSAADTIDYYERLAAANGGLAMTRQWSRLFLVPGMGHCAGGAHTLDRFDLLSALVEWVEQGRAPDSITATGAALPGTSRPLCPYPEHTHYRGAGDPSNAASFECRARP